MEMSKTLEISNFSLWIKLIVNLESSVICINIYNIYIYIYNIFIYLYIYIIYIYIKLIYIIKYIWSTLASG